ncbi:MAG: hypothetical protein K5682_06410 [Lachnospiraceae bacterium]|nr:hypothetical protein [Lachnospiraceae bacterium]
MSVENVLAKLNKEAQKDGMSIESFRHPILVGRLFTCEEEAVYHLIGNLVAYGVGRKQSNINVFANYHRMDAIVRSVLGSPVSEQPVPLDSQINEEWGVWYTKWNVDGVCVVNFLCGHKTCGFYENFLLVAERDITRVDVKE